MTIIDRAKELLLNKQIEDQIQEDIKEIVIDFVFMPIDTNIINKIVFQIKEILEKYKNDDKISDCYVDYNKYTLDIIYIKFKILNEAYIMDIKIKS